MIENALGKQDAHRIAHVPLPDRIFRDEAKVDVKTGPEVRRQVVVAGVLDLAAVAAGHQQVDFEALGFRLVDPLDTRAHRDHAIVVLGLVFQPQDAAPDPRRRRRQFDVRGPVGQQLERPVAQALAVLDDENAPARREVRRDPVGIAADRLEGAAVRSDDQSGQLDARSHLRQQAASDGHPHRRRRRAVLGGWGGFQEERRQAGVVRRIDPDVEAGRQTRHPVQQLRRQRCAQAVLPVALRDDNSDENDQEDRGAQRERVGGRQPRVREADAQAGDLPLQALAMRLPEVPGLRIVGRRYQFVLE